MSRSTAARLPASPLTAGAGTAHTSLLRDQVAVVTGSSRGIGKAIARTFVAHGAHVVVNGIDTVMVDATAAELGARACAWAGDLTRPGAPEQIVSVAQDTYGRLDIVVNNAGYCWDAPLEDMSDEQIDAMLHVHVGAPLRVLRAAAPLLCRAHRQGGRRARVLNVSSVSGTMGTEHQVNYAAAKAALVGLTKALAKEWGGRGVNVNAIAPGFIDTRLTALADEGETIVRNGREIPIGISEERRRRAWERVPMGRPGTAQEVANAALFLCSPLADYVQGQTLAVTGGLAMGMTG